MNMSIKLLACDVDGTLTDGKTIFSGNGEIYKSFSVIDGMGFELLKRHGIKIAWITGSKEKCIELRAKHCNIDYLFIGIKNKLKLFENTFITEEIKWENIAYIGDDINDLECIKKAGFSGVPFDAWIKKYDVHNYTCQREGGNGAVREFIEVILDMMHLQ